MRFFKFLVFVLVIQLVFGCGPTIYKAENFEASRNKIKTLAILPFNVSIDSKRLPKGITIETLKESQGNVYGVCLK